jgi:hypothetical protein
VRVLKAGAIAQRQALVLSLQPPPIIQRHATPQQFIQLADAATGTAPYRCTANTDGICLALVLAIAAVNSCLPLQLLPAAVAVSRPLLLHA